MKHFVSRIFKLQSAPYLIVAGYVFSIIFGLKQFTVWSQILTNQSLNKETVVDIGERTFAFGSLFVHLPRLFLMKPIFIISDLISVDPHYIFSLTVSLIVILSSILLVKRSRAFYGEDRLAELFIICTLIGLSYFMNGRMTWCILAISLLLWLDGYLEKTESFPSIKLITTVIFFALWMLSVSTGAFSIGFIIILIWVVFFLRKMRSKINGGIKLPLALLILLVPLFIAGIIKNLIYFGGDPLAFINMLQHGFGRWIIPYFAAVILVMFLLWKFRHRLLPPTGWELPLLTIVAGTLGSVYGYSTVTVAVPGLVLLIASAISLNFREKESSKT